MHGQTLSGKTHFSKRLTRKAKNSMVHILDMVKSRLSNKSKKATAAHSHASQQSEAPNSTKLPLSRKLTQDEITETELALTRLQAETQRLEELLNSGRHIAALCSSGTPSYSNSCEDVSSNNNVRKELVKIPRYQQKVAFLLHDVFTPSECEEVEKELESNKEDERSLESMETSTTHSEAMLNRLWPVIEKELPKTWMGNKLLGLSNRCIVQNQKSGYSQKAQMDEAYEPIEGKEKSFFSVYLFLNDDYEGGRASFLKNWQPSSQDVEVKPTKGSVFVHQHNLLHQVKDVTSGTKRIARMDVVYDTSKRDILAEMYD